MKRKIFVIAGLLLLGLIANRGLAQGRKNLEIGIGTTINKDYIFTLRVGYVVNHFGVEAGLEFADPKSLKGKVDGKHKGFAFMGGLSWKPISLFMLTANLGYGKVGDYHFDENQQLPVLENSRTGVMAGGNVTIYPFFASGSKAMGAGFSLGYTVIPAFGDTKPVEVFILGFVYSFNLKKL